MSKKNYKNSSIETFQNNLINIDSDLTEIIGESKIVIGDTTFYLNDYRYLLFALAIILVILIARSIT